MFENGLGEGVNRMYFQLVKEQYTVLCHKLYINFNVLLMIVGIPLPARWQLTLENSLWLVHPTPGTCNQQTKR